MQTVSLAHEMEHGLEGMLIGLLLLDRLLQPIDEHVVVSEGRVVHADADPMLAQHVDQVLGGESAQSGLLVAARLWRKRTVEAYLPVVGARGIAAHFQPVFGPRYLTY